MGALRVGDPLDKSTDIGAIVAPVQLERIRRLVRAGRAGGARDLPRRRFRCPIEAASIPPTLVTGVDPATVLAREEIFGPVLVADDVPHAGRGGRARQQHPLRPRRLRMDGEHQSRARGRGARQGGRRVDQFAPTCSTPPLASAAIAKAVSAARAGARACTSIVSPTSAKARPTSARPPRLTASPGAGADRNIADEAIDRTAKMYIGGKQARPDCGYSYAVLDPAGREIGLAGLGNRKDIRNAVEAAAKAAAWGGGDGAQSRPGALLCRRESRRRAESEFARASAP